MKVKEGTVAGEEAGPARTALKEVIQEAQKGSGPGSQEGGEKAEPGETETHTHSQPTGGREDLGGGAATSSGVLVRHGHRLSVATDKGRLETGNLAGGESVPGPDGVAQP